MKSQKLIPVIALSMMLTACGTADRIAQIGKEPAFTKFENPVYQPDYEQVSLPMPSKEVAVSKPNSLWQDDRQTFFKDQRANEVGDILTVVIAIDDEAELENETTRTRTGNEDANLPNILGLETALDDFLPEAVNPDELVNFGSTSGNSGNGSIEREEQIELELAAVVTQVLPNGNMVIYGRQEVRVNYELRELKIAGIIRPQDIQGDNTISHDKIAEARISYGGRGHISEIQKPRYGQEFFDVVFPF